MHFVYEIVSIASEFDSLISNFKVTCTVNAHASIDFHRLRLPIGIAKGPEQVNIELKYL